MANISRRDLFKAIPVVAGGIVITKSGMCHGPIVGSIPAKNKCFVLKSGVHILGGVISVENDCRLVFEAGSCITNCTVKWEDSHGS